MEYAKRDIIAQGNHYLRHIMAMTQEGLHDKSDIAAELAHRDERIAALERDLAAAQAENKELRFCLSRAIEMTDEAWSDLTYRERAMLKPTIDQWRAAIDQAKEGV